MPMVLLQGISMAVWGMASAGRLTWQAGLALLFAMVANVVWESRSASEEGGDADEENGEDRATPPVAAVALGVSQTVIGHTIVAAGTSMPELVTSLVAGDRGKADLAIGNVVGSNLLNQVLILGLCGVVSGGRGLAVDPVMVSRDLPIFWTNGVITRLEGWLLLGLYGLYLVEQVLAATSGGEMVDTFRFVVLVAVLPVLLVFLVWQGLRWRQQRQLPAAISD